MSTSKWTHNTAGRTVPRKKKGRGGGPPFVMMPKYLLTSPAWWSLTGLASQALLEIARRWDHYIPNNGKLHLSARELATLKDCSPDTAARAIRELLDRGFIDLVKGSGFNVKEREHQAAEYRLNWLKCDATGALSSKAFMKWRPARSDQPDVGVRSVGRETQNIEKDSPHVRSVGRSGPFSSPPTSDRSDTSISLPRRGGRRATA